MRFLYLLFAVAFLFSVQAEDAEPEQEQQGDPWEGLDEFQDQPPDDLGADDDAAEDRGKWKILNTFSLSWRPGFIPALIGAAQFRSACSSPAWKRSKCK